MDIIVSMALISQCIEHHQPQLIHHTYIIIRYKSSDLLEIQKNQIQFIILIGFVFSLTYEQIRGELQTVPKNLNTVWCCMQSLNSYQMASRLVLRIKLHKQPISCTIVSRFYLRHRYTHQPDNSMILLSSCGNIILRLSCG